MILWSALLKTAVSRTRKPTSHPQDCAPQGAVPLSSRHAQLTLASLLVVAATQVAWSRCVRQFVSGTAGLGFSQEPSNEQLGLDRHENCEGGVVTLRLWFRRAFCEEIYLLGSRAI